MRCSKRLTRTRRLLLLLLLVPSPLVWTQPYCSSALSSPPLPPPTFSSKLAPHPHRLASPRRTNCHYIFSSFCSIVSFLICCVSEAASSCHSHSPPILYLIVLFCFTSPHHTPTLMIDPFTHCISRADIECLAYWLRIVQSGSSGFSTRSLATIRYINTFGHGCAAQRRIVSVSVC